MSQSFGRVDFDPVSRKWVIECKPHISMRLKRIFGKIEPGSQGQHRISATRENARDLRWVLQRFPMEVPDMARLERDAIAHKQMEAQVQSIVAGDYVPPNFELALPAREYQKLPAAMLLTRGGLLLGDDLGCGKTLSAIYSFQDPRTLPALVVVLANLAEQWRAEIKRFAPKLKVHIIKKGTPYNIRFHSGAMPDVIIVSYSKLVGWAETLVSPPISCRSVYYDEVSELRRAESDKYTSAEHVSRNVQYRCGLSGTAFYNYGGEMYNILQCLFPDEMGTRQEFGSEWCDGSTGDKAAIKDPQAFGAWLRDQGLLLRRTRTDIGRELPPCQVMIQHVDCDTEALDRMAGSAADLARIILHGANDGPKGQKMLAAGEFDRMLRQATGIAKAPAIADFVRLILESGEQVLLGLHHRAVYAILMERLKEFNPVMYTGSESLAQKEASKKAFIEGKSRLFMMALRAGSGVDGLQYSKCRTVVVGELDWSPAIPKQLIGRVWRDGQDQGIFVYHLISDEGSDPTVLQVNGVKIQQIEGVTLNPEEQRELTEPIQRDDSHIKKLAQAYLEKASRKQADDAADLAVQ